MWFSVPDHRVKFILICLFFSRKVYSRLRTPINTRPHGGWHYTNEFLCFPSTKVWSKHHTYSQQQLPITIYNYPQPFIIIPFTGEHLRSYVTFHFLKNAIDHKEQTKVNESQHFTSVLYTKHTRYPKFTALFEWAMQLSHWSELRYSLPGKNVLLHQHFSVRPILQSLFQL